MIDITKLVRKNILEMQRYSSARETHYGMSGIFLDANENSLGSVTEKNYNRYPDPFQNTLKGQIAKLKNVRAQQIFLGNGSDEAIDLLIRVFCEPGNDEILVMAPTYGMYKVCAAVNNVTVNTVSLNHKYDIDLNSVKMAISDQTKLIFLCSPNNPTGNELDATLILEILNHFTGLVVIDEAYIDFSTNPGWLPQLNKYKNLVILQTFSKAWGLAAVRLGMAFAHESIIALLHKIKYPYNINQLTQEVLITAIQNYKSKDKMVTELLNERKKVEEKLARFSFVKKIHPSQANFLLVRFDDHLKIYNYLLGHGILVRNYAHAEYIPGCLRITIGTKDENNKLLNLLEKLDQA